MYVRLASLSCKFKVFISRVHMNSLRLIFFLIVLLLKSNHGWWCCIFVQLGSSNVSPLVSVHDVSGDLDDGGLYCSSDEVCPTSARATASSPLVPRQRVAPRRVHCEQRDRNIWGFVLAQSMITYVWFLAPLKPIRSPSCIIMASILCRSLMRTVYVSAP